MVIPFPKSMALIIIWIACSIYTNAQNGMPAFAKIDKAELLMTDCEFDKGASAIKLIDWGYTYYDKGNSGAGVFKTVFERRTRIKILNKKGLDQADVHITFYSYNNDEQIFSFNACTYNINSSGNIITTIVKSNSIYTKKINKYYSEMIITFPEAKVGSVIEFKYTMERQTMGTIRDWYFQERIPVVFSQYQLKIPQLFRFFVQPSVIDSMETKKKVIDEVISLEKGQIKTKTLLTSYTMHHLPGIKDEPYMDAAKDYMQRLEFQLSQIDYGNNDIQDLRRKWSDVITDLAQHENFGLQLEKIIPGTAPLITAANNIKDDEEKMKFIYNSIRKSISWNENEDVYTEIGISNAWKTKSGNTADINLLLVKLLTDAGINAYPVLFSTRDHGLVNTHYPFLNQFNTVMAFVQLNGKDVVLDATDSIVDYKLTPENIINTSGFIVKDEDGKWKRFSAGNYKYKSVIAIQGAMDSSGMMKGDALINSSEYARKDRCESWLKSKEQFKNAYFNTSNSNVTIDTIVVNNATQDSLPLEQKIKFSEKLNGADNYRFFHVNLFSGLDFNPFIDEDRISDINFGYQQQFTIFGNYTIADNYRFETLPDNIVMIMPDTSIIFTRSMQADENLLNVRITLEFKQALYPASDYSDVAAFYKKLFARLNEQVVIKTKQQ